MFHLHNAGSHGLPTIEHFFRIVPLGLGKGVGFSARLNLQHLADGDVRSLDLGGEYSFLRSQWREENMGIRDRGQQTIVTRKTSTGSGRLTESSVTNRVLLWGETALNDIERATLSWLIFT